MHGPPEVRAVLFDLYGTLMDIVVDETSPAFWESMTARLGSDRVGVAARQLQLRYLSLCRAQARRGPGHLLDRVFERLLRGLGRPSSRRDVERLGELFRGSSTKRLQVKPYAASILGTIRRSGCRVGLVSNTEAVLTRLDLRRSGLRRYFGVIVLSSEVGLTKPDPRIFARALHRLRVDPGKAIFVGNDMRADIAGARRAGLRALFINPAGPAFVTGGLASGPEVTGTFPRRPSILSGLRRLGWEAPGR